MLHERFKMKNLNEKHLNAMLAVGMLLMFSGILAMVGFMGSNEQVLLSVLSAMISLAGFVFLYIFLGFSRTSFKLFMGLLFSMNGIFLFVSAREILPLPLRKLWPLMILFTSLSLFFAGRIKKNKFNLSYDYTAIFLFTIGVFLLLFSLGIIKMPLGEIMVFLLPVIFILAGIFLVVLFLQRSALLKLMPSDISSKLEEGNPGDEDGEDL